MVKRVVSASKRSCETMKAESSPEKYDEYNVCLQGASLDVGNMGVRALITSLIKLVITARPNARINLLYGNRTAGVQNFEVAGKTIELNIVNCRLSPLARINEHIFYILFLAVIQRIMPFQSVRDKIIRSNRWLRTLNSADFVGEIRGGDSLSDIYGLRRFAIGIMPAIIAILMRKDLVLLPQTYGPYSSPVARMLGRFVVMRAARVYSRDRGSIELLREMLGRKGENKQIRFCPDVAFVLDSVEPKEVNIEPPLEDGNSAPLIGLNISSMLYIGGFKRDNTFGLKFDYKQFVPAILKNLLEKTTAHVLLVPHVFSSNVEGDEFKVCSEIRDSMGTKYGDRLHLILSKYDQSQAKGIIGLCDFFVGSRMHSCIAALSQGIPTVGLAYSKKFVGVFETVGMEEWVIDMRQTEQEESIITIFAAFEKRQVIAAHLRSVIPAVKEQILNTFNDIL